MGRKKTVRKSARQIMKLGRPKKLTARELRKAVEDYFLSICYLEDVILDEPVVLAEDPQTGAVTYHLDKYGHVMTRRVPVIGGDGLPLQRLCWITPPGEEDLCVRIGIHKSTWDRYGSGEDEEYREIVALARGRIRAYLEGATENRHGGKGAQFKLERIYEMQQKVSVKVSGGVEEYLEQLGGETEF